jgi:hypothetical protein
MGESGGELRGELGGELKGDERSDMSSKFMVAVKNKLLIACFEVFWEGATRLEPGNLQDSVAVHLGI